MRQIKYRAYHKTTREMFWFDVMNGNHGHGNGYIGMAPFGEEITKARHRDNLRLVDPTDCDIMQFTGLHDKNGKEIYEGDIDSRRNVIMWNKDLCLFCPHSTLPHDGEWYPTSYPMDARNIEVIGNIHENPELLKK